jgi:hypothetical protein
MSYKNGDIVRWSFTGNKLKKLGRTDSEAYWCMSRIAIYKDGRFVDTYWHGGSSHNRSFTVSEISISPECVNSEIYEVSFIANIDDLNECRETEFSYYNESDFVNISHPNSTRTGFYIRKGATKSLEKMRKVILAHAEYYARQEASAKREVERLENDMKTLTTESYLPCNPDVYI